MPNDKSDTTVTVSAADLEALLFATSGIKDIEAALDQRRRNPMVAAGTGRLAGAHDRLSAAWRRAKREADWPVKVVTEADIRMLRAMFDDGEGGLFEVALLDGYPTRLAQELMLVEAGPRWDGYRIEWPAPAEPQFVTVHLGPLAYAARLTHYGKQVLGLGETGGLRPIGDVVGNVVSRVEGARQARLASGGFPGKEIPSHSDNETGL